jgi:hypothetical protein
VSSIRRKLLVSLLAGMLSFCAILTLVFYFYAERVLVKHFDDSLSQHLSTFTRMTERERDEFDFDFEQLRLPEFATIRPGTRVERLWSGPRLCGARIYPVPSRRPTSRRSSTSCFLTEMRGVRWFCAFGPTLTGDALESASPASTTRST